MPRWICISLAPSLLDLCILTAGKMNQSGPASACAAGAYNCRSRSISIVANLSRRARASSRSHSWSRWPSIWCIILRARRVSLRFFLTALTNFMPLILSRVGMKAMTSSISCMTLAEIIVAARKKRKEGKKEGKKKKTWAKMITEGWSCDHKIIWSCQ